MVVFDFFKKMKLVFGVLFLAVFSSGCFNLTVNAEGFCKDFGRIKIPGINIDLPKSNIEVPYDFDLARIAGSFQSLTTSQSLSLQSIEFTALEGIEDFSFIDSVAGSIASGDPNSTLSPVQVFSYQRLDKLGKTVLIEGLPGHDLGYLAKEAIVQLRVSAIGKAPMNDWAVNMKMCFNASVNRDFLH